MSDNKRTVDGNQPKAQQTTIDLSGNSAELGFFVNKEAIRSGKLKVEAEQKDNTEEAENDTETT